MPNVVDDLPPVVSSEQEYSEVNESYQEPVEVQPVEPEVVPEEPPKR